MFNFFRPKKPKEPNEADLDNVTEEVMNGEIDRTKKYYAKLKEYNENTNENTKLSKTIFELYFDVDGSVLDHEVVHTCSAAVFIVTSTLTLKRLPFTYLLLIKNKKGDNKTYYKQLSSSGNSCEDLVKDAYKYENFAENYEFYTDKEQPTGGKRSKSRRQKRSAKKSRKHRKTSKK
jgi:hypothetical protein